MFVCEENHSCCNWQYCDTINDLDDEGINCGHLTEVAPLHHAKWIEEKPPRGGKIFRCSHCKNIENKHTAVLGHYCWFCGSKMDLE